MQSQMKETEMKLTKSIQLIKDKVYEIDDLKDKAAKLAMQVGLCAREDDVLSLKDSCDQRYVVRRELEDLESKIKDKAAWYDIEHLQG